MAELRPIVVPAGPNGEPDIIGWQDEHGGRHWFKTDDTADEWYFKDEWHSEVSDLADRLPPLPEGRDRRFYTVQQLGRPVKIQWLVDGWIPAGELSMIYGPGDSYKSFLALHWGLLAAEETEYKKAKDVVYIAGEGAHGLRTRVPAWLRHHERKPEEFPGFRVDEMPVMLDNPGATSAWLSEVEDELKRKPDWVIVDTLSMNFSGDESNPQDVNKFVRGLETVRRSSENRTAITIIHHTPVDKDMRERGSAALRNATGATIRLSARSPNGYSVLVENDRQKEAERHGPERFQLKKVGWKGVSSLAVFSSKDASEEVSSREERRRAGKKR